MLVRKGKKESKSFLVIHHYLVKKRKVKMGNKE